MSEGGYDVLPEGSGFDPVERRKRILENGDVAELVRRTDMSMTRAEKKAVKVLTERAMRGRFSSSLESMREKPHMAKAVKAYEDMFRRNAKKTVKALRPVFAEVWMDAHDQFCDFGAACVHHDKNNPPNPYEEV